MEAWSRLQQQVSNSIIIFAVQRSHAGEAVCKTTVGRVHVLLDPRGETAHRYNAWWLPRAYVIDADGVLTYVQPDQTMDTEAPLQVAAWWRQRR